VLTDFGRRLSAAELKRSGALGTILEEMVGEALAELKGRGLIQDFKRIVEEYTHKKREADFPDWWVLLVGGQTVEVECKNLGKSMKQYVRKPTDTPYWAYDQKWMIEHMRKVWEPKSKKVAVLSTRAWCAPGALNYLAQLDGIIEASPPSNPHQITEITKEGVLYLALDLYELFEKWVQN